MLGRELDLREVGVVDVAGQQAVSATTSSSADAQLTPRDGSGELAP
jgi:hypothetical protein